MDIDDSMFCDIVDEKKPTSSKKRKKAGRVKNVMKLLRTQSHELEPDSCYKNLRCFKAVTEDQRKTLKREFNELRDLNKQNAYLGGLISVLSVKRRKKTENHTRYSSASFAYRVRVLKEGVALDVRVCLKAFMSSHGISENKVRYIKKSLLDTG